MKKNWTIVEVLRYARHDWLNKIQLIKGNLSLGRYDRMQEIIDEIVSQSKKETKLSNLKIPRFAALILTYNWEDYFIPLEYEIVETSIPNTYSIDDNILTEWTRSFLKSIHSSVNSGKTNYLSITIEPQQKGICFFFDFSGIITRREPLNHFLQEKTSLEMKIKELSEQSLFIELFLPYHSC